MEVNMTEANKRNEEKKKEWINHILSVRSSEGSRGLLRPWLLSKELLWRKGWRESCLLALIGMSNCCWKTFSERTLGCDKPERNGKREDWGIDEEEFFCFILISAYFDVLQSLCNYLHSHLLIFYITFIYLIVTVNHFTLVFSYSASFVFDYINFVWFTLLFQPYF